jgi:hypothetical protein
MGRVRYAVQIEGLSFALYKKEGPQGPQLPWLSEPAGRAKIQGAGADHPEREPGSLLSGRVQVRSSNPSWGTGTIGLWPTVTSLSFLPTPHGEREPYRCC